MFTIGKHDAPELTLVAPVTIDGATIDVRVVVKRANGIASYEVTPSGMPDAEYWDMLNQRARDEIGDRLCELAIDAWDGVTP